MILPPQTAMSSLAETYLP